MDRVVDHYRSAVYQRKFEDDETNQQTYESDSKSPNSRNLVKFVLLSENRTHKSGYYVHEVVFDLNMNRQIVYTFRSFHDGFGNGRVSVHDAAEFVGGCFECHADAGFG